MSIIQQVFDAGIVGCGGAGFPTHVKLSGKGIRYLILNGAECEPVLGTDRWLMRNRAGDIVAAADAVAREIGAEDCVIGLKKEYTREIAALEYEIERQKAAVSLHKMDSFYPAGDEHVLVYEVTRKTVPPAGIPLDVGAVVSNVATMAAIYDAIHGIPFTQKYLTVAGAVKNPLILSTPVGTSYADCICLAGGAIPERWVAVNGGPMMGECLTMDEAMTRSVEKTTSGILIFPENSTIGHSFHISLEHMKNRAAHCCIQCTYCTELCPRHMLGHPLEPHKIMRKMALCTDFSQLLNDTDVRNAPLCSQCGVCENYACPMGLQPRRVIGLIQDELAKAGIRYQKETKTSFPLPERRNRKVPTVRAAARLGVLDYYYAEIGRFEEFQPDTVVLALDQQIGSPSQPVVKEGDQVLKGQLVARCPDGKLGANLHASITGIVTQADGCIVIQERRK